MAKLFKDKLIKEKLKSFDIPALEEKIDIVRQWLKRFSDKTLHAKTESQCEQAFNQDFFIKILGYTPFPAKSYTIEPKGDTETSAQKPDAALGVFKEGKNRVIAVCEVKDANTSLDKSQRREGNMSPVQQGFKYKPQYKDCRFVIVGNFEEIRLYKDNMLDFESFTLESLLKPKDDYYQLRKFYFLLCAENFISGRGASKTEKLLSEIRTEQEEITGLFYKEYKKLRLELVQNIEKNNRGVDKDLIIEKAQKLIDRIVFVCFCEDIGLLPEEILSRVLEYAKGGIVDFPIWEVMKKFFIAVDQGSQKLEIPQGYNGELFKPDSRLDGLIIDNDICEKFIDLSRYDFREDLSVNILGHIFEQSITDIERLKEENQDKADAPKTSKRKKDGIYYTPEYIVEYIVNQTLGGWLKEKEEELVKKHGLKEGIQDKTYEQRQFKVYDDYQKVLQKIKVLDPACGSGAFLVKVFDYLLAENKRVAAILDELRGGQIEAYGVSDFIKNILQNNIYGVDLNRESVEITKLGLWLKTAQKGRKLTNLQENIKCGNSLIDDFEIAGDKAFDWEKEFSEIMQDGGFDVVVGNPPYVRQEALGAYKPYFSEKYESYTSHSDLFVYFYEKGLKVLRESGYLGFISNTFSKTTKAGSNLRSFLKNNSSFVSLTDFSDIQVFKDATTYPIIPVLKKEKKSAAFQYLKVKPEYLQDLELSKRNDSISIKQSGLKNEYWTFESETEQKLKAKIRRHPTVKEVFGKCYYGIKTGLNEAFMISGQKRNDIISKSPQETEIIKPLFEGKDLKKWFSSDVDKWLIFIPWHFPLHENNSISGVSLEAENLFKLQYPETYKYLFRYKENLSKRNKAETGVRYEWYALQRCAASYFEEFSKKKIVWPNLQSANKFSYDEEGAYITNPSVILPTDNKVLLPILNSKVAWFFFLDICVVRSGGYIEMNPQFFQQLPVALPDNEQPFVEKADIMLAQTKELQDLQKSLLEFLQSELKPQKITKKLGNWVALDWEEFKKELGKGKATLKDLSLKERKQWQDYFNEQKAEADAVRQVISNTEKEINQMVYELYGLTEKEIKIVEESL